MAEVLLLHHSQGLTPGVRAFADELRGAGHTVHTPDLFGGRTFDSIDEGMAYIRGTAGFDELIDRAVEDAGALPEGLIYGGFSFGVMTAQKLAQTRPGAAGALLFESAAPPNYFAEGWPADVPVQIHGMDGDPFFAGEGDIEYAREIVAAAHKGELFTYPGDRHLFTDSSLPQYDAEATALVRQRVLDFLATV
jgi:dienelactone hydrolase